MPRCCRASSNSMLTDRRRNCYRNHCLGRPRSNSGRHRTKDRGLSAAFEVARDRERRPQGGADRRGLDRSSQRGGLLRTSTVKVERPKDWSGLQAAFAEKRTIAGIGRRAGKGRIPRRYRCSGLHAGIAQRRSRGGRNAEAGRAGDQVPHHEAGRRKRRRSRRSPRGAGRRTGAAARSRRLPSSRKARSSAAECET